MITNTLTITSIKTTDEYPDHPDCVKNIEWSMELSDGSNTTTKIGGVNLGSPDSENYISLPNLTEQQVLTWVENQLINDGMLDYLKRQAEQEFASSTAPTLTEETLPWEAN